ncbi:hypothetical protein [Kribbella sp. CA-293567]|uniref:hypothetical protein n=1 Tax=Kribbella sp. CA-293567 TaxID=3002436 RepID=UPI0022DE8875|nr:hypothetical protein [Kribbella sp. CA-293567]WBQ07319.1 hypothetical protein OX958_11045 [Kribbella sp. CA-293567]
MTAKLPRSAVTLLSCVVLEGVVYFVWLLTSSKVEPLGCDDHCLSGRDIAAGWGLLVIAPLAAGQLLFGGVTVALTARKGDRSVFAGLLGFFAGTALTLPILFFVYYLQSS